MNDQEKFKAALKKRVDLIVSNYRKLVSLIEENGEHFDVAMLDRTFNFLENRLELARTQAEIVANTDGKIEEAFDPDSAAVPVPVVPRVSRTRSRASGGAPAKAPPTAAELAARKKVMPEPDDGVGFVDE